MKFIDCKECIHLTVHTAMTNALNKHTGKPEEAEWYKCDFVSCSLPTTKRYSCMFFSERKSDEVAKR